ncbi:Crp/Fnr family transcriptional regulator [Frankia sp. ACN1ag]|uniref:Crp/Fnr family transcriptional regulator n=1 Tax=Frankia sp. ACN1ag TaxID=102891 RepID=UPI0006DC1E3B|nr:Crp/Fnr family transcriptional regulator [Frankia sp. ACN1ag]
MIAEDAAKTTRLPAGCRVLGGTWQPRRGPELQRWAGRFLGGLDPQTRAAVVSMGRGDAVAAGEPVLREDEAGQLVIVLLSGWVTVTAAAENGTTVLLALHHSGEVVDADTLSAVGGMRVTAGALTLVRWIPAARFAEVLAAYPSARESYCRVQCALLRQATRQWITGLAPVAVRVARTLIELRRSFAGRPDPAGRVVIPLSQSELAELAHASLPAVHRALADLRDAGVLALSRRALGIVNLPALVAAAGTTAPLAAHGTGLPDACPGCPRPATSPHRRGRAMPGSPAAP